ncbi:MAG TPA: polyhydroxyalkanoic acid system family protein [Chitinophagaceae bacterium]|nr:polyhydroxyalkanoic acid system family protein [Chitinophagaceae bacterium]
MRAFKLSIPHNLPQPEALSRIKYSLAKLKHQQKDKVSGIKEDWQEETCIFQFTALGFTVSGTLTVHPSSVEIDSKLPFTVFLFRNKIKQVISEKGKELLAA